MNRKLPQYSQFNIEIKENIRKDGTVSFYSRFTDTDSKELPSYKEKLTPSQWKKASIYLDRQLIPFCGYQYTVKPEYQKANSVYKIR